MKTLIKMSMIALIAITVASCSKKNDLNADLTADVIGSYKGTLTTNGVKSTSPATADVTAVNDYTVQIHCYGDEIDTTFNLELYENGNSMQVCFTDEDFSNEYGHQISDNHHMMGDNGSWTNWSQHMSNEHNDNDEHYGNFDMSNHQFDYTFNLRNADGSSYNSVFSGLIQQ